MSKIGDILGCKKKSAINDLVVQPGNVNGRKCGPMTKAKKTIAVGLVVLAILAAIVAVTVLTHFGVGHLKSGQSILNDKIFTAIKDGAMTAKDGLTGTTTPLWVTIVAGYGTVHLLGSAAGAGIGIRKIHQYRKDKAVENEYRQPQSLLSMEPE